MTQTPLGKSDSQVRLPRAKNTTSQAKTLVEATRNWFIDNGLPFFLPKNLRRQLVMSRLAPFTVFVIVGQISILVTSALVAFINRSPLFDFLDRPPSAETELSAHPLATVIALATLVMPILGLIAAFIFAWWVNRRSIRTQTIAGWICVFLFVFAPLLARLFTSFEGVFSSHPFKLLLGVGGRLLLVAVWFWIVYSGFGAIVTFAYRRAYRQLSLMGPMVAKALPLVVLTLLFSYLSAETWQISAGMSIESLLTVVGILFLLAVVLVLFSTKERISDRLENGVSAGRAQTLLVTAPFLSASTGVTTAAPEALVWTENTSNTTNNTLGASQKTAENSDTLQPKLSTAEQINITLLQATATLWQATLFTVIVFGFLIALSMVAMPAPVEKAWTTHDVYYLLVNEIRLPITWAQIKVALLLSAFAGLTFTAASSTEEAYQKTFLQPLNDEVERALAAKHFLLKNVLTILPTKQ